MRTGSISGASESRTRVREESEENLVRIYLFLVTILFAFTYASCVPYAHVYVSENGCTSSGDCPYGVGTPRNYYWQPLREAVVQPNAGASIIAHEVCHGWQGRSLSSLDIELDGWYDTAEAKNFPDVAYRWSFGEGKLEDAAWTCAAYYLGWELDNAREQWAERWLP